MSEVNVPPWVGRISRFSWSFVGLSLAVTVAVVGLGALRELVIPLVISVFLAVVFAPSVDWLERRRVPRPLAAVLVLLLISVVAVGSIAAVVIGVVDQADNLRARFDDVVAELDELLNQRDVSSFFDDILNGVSNGGGEIAGGLGSTVGTVVGTATGFFSGIVLGAVMLYYLLKDGPDLAASFVSRADGRANEQAARILAESAGNIRAYVKGRTILALVQGILIGVACAFLGVPLAFAVGIINVVGGYVPYVGGFIGGAFAVLMALSTGGLSLAIVVLGIVMLISLGLENLLEPALLGDKLEMHPIVVLFATVTGGLLVGITGMFLAAPTVAIVRTLYRELHASGFFEAKHQRIDQPTRQELDPG